MFLNVKLSPSAKSIYPIIGAHINREGEAFPSITRLQKLSGQLPGICLHSTKNKFFWLCLEKKWKMTKNSFLQNC